MKRKNSAPLSSLTPLQKKIKSIKAKIKFAEAAKAGNISLTDLISSIDINKYAKTSNIAFAKFLLESGVDVDSFDIGPFIINNNVEFVEYWLDKGGNVDSVMKFEEEEETIIKIAIRQRDVDMSLLLIRRGSPVEDENYDIPILIESVDQGLLEVVKCLIEARKVDINVISNFDNSSALIAAVNMDERAIGEYLLKQGADVNIQGGEENFTAIELAISRSNEEFIELLINYGAKLFEWQLQDFSVYGNLIKIINQIKNGNLYPEFDLMECVGNFEDELAQYDQQEKTINIKRLFNNIKNDDLSLTELLTKYKNDLIRESDNHSFLKRLIPSVELNNYSMKIKVQNNPKLCEKALFQNILQTQKLFYILANSYSSVHFLQYALKANSIDMELINQIQNKDNIIKGLCVQLTVYDNCTLQKIMTNVNENIIFLMYEKPYEALPAIFKDINIKFKDDAEMKISPLSLSTLAEQKCAEIFKELPRKDLNEVVKSLSDNHLELKGFIRFHYNGEGEVYNISLLGQIHNLSMEEIFEG